MNVTPLVDVALVLLIIFMAAAPTVWRFYDVIIPPKPVQGPHLSAEEQLVVSQKESGTVWLNQEEVEIGALPMRVQNILSHRMSKRVFYSGDSSLEYRTALATIDLLNRSGASIGIVTR